VNGARAVFDGVTHKATDFAGKYTMAILGDTNGDNTLPTGAGYATFSITTAGNILMTGLLADGTPISQTVPVSKYGEWPFFVSLYGGTGSVSGWVEFHGSPATDLDAYITWIKPTNRLAKYYPAGFAFNTTAIGSAYQPTNTEPALLQSIVTLASGDLAIPLMFDSTLLANNTFAVSSNAAVVALNRLNGQTVTSHFTDPVTKRSVPLNGVMLQNQQEVFGYFLRSNLSGSFSIQPQP
jgi:hypothetical protein